MPSKKLSGRNLFSFLVVGGSATALHYLLTLLFVYGAGMQVVAASTIGYGLSAIANYLLNAKLTFRSEVGYRGALRFAAMALMGWLLNYVLLRTLIAIGLPAPVAQVLTTIGVITWNYLVSAFWTFRP